MSFGTPTGSAVSNAATGTTIGVTLPATINAGDIILLFHEEQTTTPSITWPAGFTDISSPSASRTNLTLSTAWKVADGSEGGTTVTITATSTKRRTAGCIVVSGGDSGTTPTVTGANGASSLSVVCPDGTYPANHSLALLIGSQQGSTAVTWTQPTGYTEIAHAGSAGTSSGDIVLAYLTALDSGTAASTGTNTETASTTNNWVANTVTIGPAAGGGSTATGSISLSGTADWVAPAVTGVLTLGGSATAQAPAGATGALALSGAADWTEPATGSITLSGSAGWDAPPATGSLSLSGTVTARAPVTASGSLTLGGSASANGPGTTASGALALAGTATARAPVTAPGGALALTASTTAAASPAVAGVIDLSGTAHVSGVYAWSEWNGATETALTLDGEWDGAAINAVTLDTVTP